MTDLFTKYERKIQKMIDEKNFELAIKILNSMKKKAMEINSQYGLKEYKKLKEKIDNEIIYENALQTFTKAEIEYKKKDYISALNLFKKGKDDIIKSKIIKDKLLDKRLNKINSAISDINKKINFQNVVDWLLKEKDDNKYNELIDMLGKIVSRKLELIAPAIRIFIKMVNNKERGVMLRGIKGLGEIAFQRPGWAYLAINKLVELSGEDKNNDARIMALMELSRIGQANSTMLLEHVVPIVQSLRDQDQNVRSWAAITIGLMAEAIPKEATEAIPALKEALQDESPIVKQYAHKALELIRSKKK